MGWNVAHCEKRPHWWYRICPDKNKTHDEWLHFKKGQENRFMMKWINGNGICFDWLIWKALRRTARKLDGFLFCSGSHGPSWSGNAAKNVPSVRSFWIPTKAWNVKEYKTKYQRLQDETSKNERRNIKEWKTKYQRAKDERSERYFLFAFLK